MIANAPGGFTPAVLETLRHAQFSQTLDLVNGVVSELEAVFEAAPWLEAFPETLDVAATQHAGYAPDSFAAPYMQAAPMKLKLVREDLEAVRARLAARSDFKARDTIGTIDILVADLDAVEALGWPPPWPDGDPRRVDGLTSEAVTRRLAQKSAPPPQALDDIARGGEQR